MPSGKYKHNQHPPTEFRKGSTPWNKGKHVKLRPDGYKHSEETKKKITKANIKNGKKRRGIMPKNLTSLHGKNHWNYKDGRTNNHEYCNWQKNERNRIKRRAFGNHTFGEFEDLKAKYNWTCPCCNKSEPEIKLTEDHIIPLSRGGSDNIENIQPLCRKCNFKKHTAIVKY